MRIVFLIYLLVAAIHRFASAVLEPAAKAVVRWQSRVPLQLRLCLGFALTAAGTLWLGLKSGLWIDGYLQAREEFGWILAGKYLGIPAEYARFQQLAVGVAAGCALAALAAFVKHRAAQQIMQGTWFCFSILWMWLLLLISSVPSRLYDFNAEVFGKDDRNFYWLVLGGLWSAASLIPIGVMFGLFGGAARKVYGGVDYKRPTWTDHILSSLHEGGDDPRFRSSVRWAVFLFAAVLLFPLAFRSCGMEEPYGLIKGQGEAAVQMVTQKKKKKPKKKKKLVVNAWSPYIFEQPDLEDITTIDELEELTSDQYVAQVGKTGNLGSGGKGPGGWPHGMTDGKIRFIRLEYAGGDWDQDMGKGADYNLLLRFREITGFKIADDTESLKIHRLRNFPPDRAPPFVFITGQGGMNLSSSEVKTLRWYCLEEGGCLFIDNGGGTFDSSVTNLVRRVFPGKQLKEIADDDPIFREPFHFPNGAPPLWHHAGERAKGVRHNGRWVVFYHPGDMNDAWKTGHSKTRPEVTEQAYRLGINVMYYTFHQYHRIHFEE